jgi:hypothetical protein
MNSFLVSFVFTLRSFSQSPRLSVKTYGTHSLMIWQYEIPNKYFRHPNILQAIGVSAPDSKICHIVYRDCSNIQVYQGTSAYLGRFEHLLASALRKDSVRSIQLGSKAVGHIPRSRIRTPLRRGCTGAWAFSANMSLPSKCQAENLTGQSGIDYISNQDISVAMLGIEVCAYVSSIESDLISSVWQSFDLFTGEDDNVVIAFNPNLNANDEGFGEWDIFNGLCHQVSIFQHVHALLC